MSHSTSFAEFQDRLARRNAIRAAMDNESVTALLRGDFGPPPPAIGSVAWARLCQECEALSAKEEGMTIADYRILNGRNPITGV